MSKFFLLQEAIESNSPKLVHAILKEIKADIEGGDVNAIEHIATPVNITALHNDLVEKLGVNRRLLQLRGRVPNAAHRAALFTQAMINGVGYLL